MIHHLKTVTHVEINLAFYKMISLNWLKLMKKHTSQTASQPNGKNSMGHASTFGLSSILWIELLNGPQSTQLLIRAEMCPAIDRTFKMDESVPLGPLKTEYAKQNAN